MFLYIIQDSIKNEKKDNGKCKEYVSQRSYHPYHRRYSWTLVCKIEDCLLSSCLWQFIYKIICPHIFFVQMTVTWMWGKHIKPKYHTGSQMLMHASKKIKLPSELFWWELAFSSASYALFISPFPFHPRLCKRSSSSFSISTSASSLNSWSNPKRCNKPWTWKKD